jgi:hypothetical protein
MKGLGCPFAMAWFSGCERALSIAYKKRHASSVMQKRLGFSDDFAFFCSHAGREEIAIARKPAQIN